MIEKEFNEEEEIMFKKEVELETKDMLLDKYKDFLAKHGEQVVKHEKICKFLWLEPLTNLNSFSDQNGTREIEESRRGCEEKS